MKEVLYKFYDMETITEEKLNNLALERNTFAKEIERLNNIINELKLLAIDEKENKYWGNDSYINGKNEGVEELANAILEILDKEK